ncbi:MAG: hypothetical protein K2M10_07615, partial [Muribaculaceae bacterium]|nr:hypothetical protein [Muribaculaceae bacterium]
MKTTNKTASRITAFWALLTVLLTAASCSTTRRIPEGETRYTGVGKMDVIKPKDVKMPSTLMADMNQAVDCDPNNYIFASFIKIPVGLWVYNNWNDSTKGIGGWLYKKLVKQPVLISDVRAEMRTKLMEQILDNNGYFGSTVTYDVAYNKRNHKKAAIDYTIHLSNPYPIDSIIYLDDNTRMAHFVDSIAKKSHYLKKGEIFCVDSLAAERVRIANVMRNRGYYYFRPEYIEFLADSLINPGKIAIKLDIAENTPSMALQQYRVRNIYTTVLRKSKRNPGVPDTIQTNRGEVIVMQPARLRKNLIPSCITFRKGKLFSVRDMDRTQTRLSRLGIFGNIQIQPVPVDTTAGHAMLDVYTTCQFENPIEASIEVNATSKSNSYIGPGLVLGLSHNNVFGGGERLSLELDAEYEWQTGKNKGSVFNSYEFGLTATLAFPRMLAPKFIKRTERELNWTTISLGASILN